MTQGGHLQVETLTVAAASERQPLLPDEQRVIRTTGSSDQQHPIPSNSSLHDANNAFHTLDRYSFQLLATMLNFFTSGVALTAVGALLPDIEHFYLIKDSTVAFIFPLTVAGYLVSTLTTQTIHFNLGRRGIAWLSSILRLFCSAILSTGPPFPLSLATYFVFGYSAGLTDSGWCAWAANLPYANVAQGLLHGSFAVGCVLGPLITIAMFKKNLAWYSFYHVIAVLALLELIAQGWAFRRDGASRYRLAFDTQHDHQKFHPLKLKSTWICGLYYLVYIGIEASFSDWIVVYMQRTRQIESTASRLASSAFWLGMSLGRFTLGPITEHYGLSSSVLVYMIFCACLQILFRFVKNLAVSLATLGMIGFFCGPMFPSGLLLLTRSLPEHIHVGAVAAAAAMGQLGGATVPLGVGYMAERLGIRHLLDVVFSLSMLMILIWVLFSWLTKRLVTSELVT